MRVTVNSLVQLTLRGDNKPTTFYTNPPRSCTLVVRKQSHEPCNFATPTSREYPIPGGTILKDQPQSPTYGTNPDT